MTKCQAIEMSDNKPETTNSSTIEKTNTISNNQNNHLTPNIKTDLSKHYSPKLQINKIAHTKSNSPDEKLNKNQPLIININNYTYPAQNSTTLQQPEIKLHIPEKINLDNNVDVATMIVGLAGIISSIVIARYTSKSQSNQIKANIANMRQKWIEELRNQSAIFIQKASILLNTPMETELDSQTYSEMLAAQIKISLMLDKKHEENKNIIKTSEDMIKTIKERDKEKEIEKKNYFHKIAMDFENELSTILEKAWRDIKSDLNN